MTQKLAHHTENSHLLNNAHLKHMRIPLFLSLHTLYDNDSFQSDKFDILASNNTP